ncbi:MAG: serpin family protein [Candidatus Caenarcaniphilales bacterium]|nr:serpin family protein [Candidatus Caenarcaniphilales bacterium]
MLASLPFGINEKALAKPDHKASKSENIKSISSSSAHFTWHILSKQCSNLSENQNCLFAPYALAPSLIYLSGYAHGNTQEALWRVLGYRQTSTEDTFPRLPSIDEDRVMHFRSSLWYELPQPPDIKILHASSAYPRFDWQGIKSDGETIETRKTLQDWLNHGYQYDYEDHSNQTKLSELEFGSITSAATFSLDLEQKVTKASPRPFYDSKTNLAYLHRTGKMLYREGKNYQAVLLSLSGRDKELILILPKAKTRSVLTPFMGSKSALKDATELAKTFRHADEWQKLLKGMKVLKGSLYFPALKTRSEEELSNALSESGMAVAFTSGSDFGDLKDAADNALKLSQIWQFVGIETETASSPEPHSKKNQKNLIKPKTATISGEKPAVNRSFLMNIDRPFLIVIIDRKSGEILLGGVIANPFRQDY